VFWIVTGCAGLIAIAVVLVVGTGLFVAYKAKQAGFDPALIEKNPGLAVAKILANANPDLEVLGVDEDRGIIRVREKKTGKSLTMNLDEIRSGKIVLYDENNQRVEIQARGEGDSASLQVRTPDATMQLGTAPGKLPDWLPVYPGATGVGGMSEASKDRQAATYTYRTKDSPEDVANFYQEALQNGGFEVQRTDAGMITLAATHGDAKRNAHVTAVPTDSGTMINLSFGVGPQQRQ
jgi:hypothetical protein